MVELSGLMYQVGTNVFDRTFRGFLQSPNATATEHYCRACTGLAHPIANLLITRDVDDAGLLSEAVTPLCVDAFPSCVFCLGPPSQEVDALLTGRGFQRAEELPVMAVDIQKLKATELGKSIRFSVLELNAMTFGSTLWPQGMSCLGHLPICWDRVWWSRLSRRARSIPTFSSFMAIDL